MRAHGIDRDGYKSIEQIDREMSEQIRAFVRRERIKAALWRSLLLGAVTLAWWLR